MYVMYVRLLHDACFCMLSWVRFVGMCVMFNILLSTIVTSMYLFTGVLHVACLCMSPCLCFVNMFYITACQILLFAYRRLCQVLHSIITLLVR